MYTEYNFTTNYKTRKTNECWMTNENTSNVAESDRQFLPGQETHEVTQDNNSKSDLKQVYGIE